MYTLSMYWSTFNVRMYHTVFLVCESDFFWDFFSTWTEDLKIEGVRFCEDSEVLWDRPVILGFINKLDWTCVEWKSSFTVSESAFHFGTYERCVCVCAYQVSVSVRQVVVRMCVCLFVSVELQPSSRSCPSRRGLPPSEGRRRRWGRWTTAAQMSWQGEETDEKAERKREEPSITKIPQKYSYNAQS